MPSVNPFNRLKNLNVSLTFYSEPGCGKTHMAFASQMRWFVISTEMEQSLVTLDNVVSKGYFNPTMRIFPVRNMTDYNEALQEITAHADEYDGVIFDHLTDFQKYKTRSLLNSNTDRKMPALTIGEWGILSNSTIAAVERINRLPIHKVFLIHEKVDKDEEAGTRHVGGSLSGKTFAAVSGMGNVCGRLYIKEDSTKDGKVEYKHLVKFMPSGRISAKPHGSLRPIEEVNIDFIIAKMLKAIPTEMNLDEFMESWRTVPFLRAAEKKYKAEMAKENEAKKPVAKIQTNRKEKGGK